MGKHNTTWSEDEKQIAKDFCMCPLLGIKLGYNGKRNNRDTSPSVDRIDSSLGYTKDNVWIISYRANRIKNDATLRELELITNNLRSKINPHL